jgi:tetratricopeptide (TPR) repeat protein
MADRPIPNTALRTVREGELQMSRQEFARAVVNEGREQGEAVACSARLVAAWEDGDVRAPRPVYRRILTAMTGRSMADLGFRVNGTTAPGRTPASAVDGWQRRAVLADGMGAAVSLIPLGDELGAAPGRIGVVEVRAVDRAVATVYAHDHDHGSAALRSGASQALRTAYQWLQEGSYTERTGRRLRLATGHLSIAAGWLSYDSGRPSDARSLYGEALAAARVADDRALEAHAFGCLALLAKAAGRPREAIAAAQGAQSVARTYGSPRMLSMMAMREAGGWALMGDRSATEQALVRAHHLYAKGPRDADPTWLEFFSPGELAGLEALARADLGQHERAAAGAEQAILLHGEQFTRNRALYIGDVAIQHAVRARPEPEAAAEAADRALAHLPTVRSDRLLQQLHNVASALQRHASVPAVADWLEKYRTTTDVS